MDTFTRSSALRVGIFVCVLGALTGKALYTSAHNDTAAKNKAIVTEFYNLIFRDHKPEDAFARYGGPKYVQHNPRVPDGSDAMIKYFVPYFNSHPDARNDIKRAVAEGNLVVLHVHSKQNTGDRGRAIVDIFRVDNGKVVEHWDVIQEIPDQSANDNGVF
jgi:predicted SnoaL-like aldol condensation-catalyzing enzyme